VVSNPKNAHFQTGNGEESPTHTLQVRDEATAQKEKK
jgi:hypothetical protein